MMLETMSENFRSLWWKLNPLHAFEVYLSTQLKIKATWLSPEGRWWPRMGFLYRRRKEMIIRRRKDRFIAEIVPNVPVETHRRSPIAAATGSPDICQISPALLLRRPLFHILKNCCCCSRSSSTITCAADGTYRKAPFQELPTSTRVQQV